MYAVCIKFYKGKNSGIKLINDIFLNTTSVQDQGPLCDNLLNIDYRLDQKILMIVADCCMSVDSKEDIFITVQVKEKNTKSLIYMSLSNKYFISQSYFSSGLYVTMWIVDGQMRPSNFTQISEIWVIHYIFFDFLSCNNKGIIFFINWLQFRELQVLPKSNHGQIVPGIS